MNGSQFWELYQSYGDVYRQEVLNEEYGEIDEELTGSRLRRAKQMISKIDQQLSEPGNKTNPTLWSKRAHLRRVAGNVEGSFTPSHRDDDYDFKGPRGRGGRGYKGGPKTIGQSGSLDRPMGNKTSTSVLKAIQRHQKKINASYDYDLYDVVLEHLLYEGYAETPEDATVLMANMSEQWFEAIVEENSEELAEELAEDASTIKKYEDLASQAIKDGDKQRAAKYRIMIQKIQRTMSQQR